MNLTIALIIIIWVVGLIILNNLKVYPYKFIWGVLGLFVVAINLTGSWLSVELSSLVANIMHFASKGLKFFTVIPAHSMVNIINDSTAVTFFIDYECSGIIEILVFISLMVFYPLYKPLSKVLTSALGICVIIFGNVFRLIVIALCIYIFGSESLFIAHTIVGRLVFYCIVTILYFNVFTRAHILSQKVGGLNYDGTNT